MGVTSTLLAVVTAFLIVGAGYAAVLAYHINTAAAALPEVAEAPSAAEVAAAARVDEPLPLQVGEYEEAPPG